MSNSNTHVTVLPISFSVGFINEDDKYWIFRTMKTLDPHAWITKPRTPQRQKMNIKTGEKQTVPKFNMLVQHGQEKRLFFKLKLKYPEFKRHCLNSR
jgi:hypothetical protein